MDMCLCLSEECPEYKRCYRGGANKYVGICTMSRLGEVCHRENGFELFVRCPDGEAQKQK